MRRFIEKENELKLDILESLSRSQRALASIIEHMEETVRANNEISKGMLEHVRPLGDFQRALALRILGIRIRRTVIGKPGQWWLAGGVKRGTNRK